MKVSVKLPLRPGVKYYTLGGKPVQIYFTKAGGDYPIHGAVFNHEILEWVMISFTPQGRLSITGRSELDIAFEEWTPEDKELVWCWNNEDRFVRELKFYDAKNHCVFRNLDGDRGGKKYDNYAPFEYEYPEWAKEAYEELKNGKGERNED